MELADVGEALPLADGSFLLPTGKVVRPRDEAKEVIVLPKASEAIALVSKVRRKLADLPAVPDTMNVVNVVLMYTLYGLEDEQIGIATGLTADQVVKIRTHDAYKSASALAREAILSVESSDVKEILSSGARTAAKRIVNDASNPGVSGFVAAQDVLNRTGYGAQGQAAGDALKGSMLMIEVVRKDTNKGEVSIKLKVGTDG